MQKAYFQDFHSAFLSVRTISCVLAVLAALGYLPSVMADQIKQSATITSAPTRTVLPEVPVRKPMQFAELADLTPGGRVMAAVAKLTDTRNKSLALILNNKSIASFQEMQTFHRKMIVFAEGQSDAKYRTLFENLANSVNDRFAAREIAYALRLNFKAVNLVKDLPEFLAGDADLAIVIDFQFEQVADKLIRELEKSMRGIGSEGTFRRDLAISGALKYVVLNRDLEVVSFRLLNSGLECSGPESMIPTNPDALSFTVHRTANCLSQTFGGLQRRPGYVSFFALPLTNVISYSVN